MIESTNPFRIESGNPDHNWVGRSDFMEEYSGKLQLIKEGHPARGMMILGLHGVGKSALMRKFQAIAEERDDGTITHFIDASQGVSVIDRLHAIVQGRIWQPTRIRTALHWFGWQAKRLLRFLHRWLVKFATKQLPEPPRFMDQLIRFGKDLRRTNKRMVIYIDDLHTASNTDLQRLATVFRSTEGENLPFLFVVAGHRIMLRQYEEMDINIRWILDEHELHWLSHDETCSLLVRAAQQQGREFSREAMEEIYRISKGYPHLVQLLARQVWKDGRSPVMTVDDVIEATPVVKRKIGNNLYGALRKKLGPAELGFAMAMASLPADARTLDNVYRIIGGVEADHAQTMDNLRLADVIYFPASNQVEFKAPLFDEYLLNDERNPEKFDG